MDAILRQLELDSSFFYELGIFWVLFLVLAKLYFQPFQRLLDLRHKKTVEDRVEAERLMAQADRVFEEYSSRIQEEKVLARKNFDELLQKAKREETEMINQSRADAKKITQEAIESIEKQRDALRKKLEIDVEGFAQQISQKLLGK